MHIFAVINILYIVAFESDKTKLGIFVGIKTNSTKKCRKSGAVG